MAGSRGQEIGLKSEILPELQTSLALWRLDFDSELVELELAELFEESRLSVR